MRYRISCLMDEIWERAVETALEGQTDHSLTRSLTLDGAVKCVHGRLPPPSLLEKFQNLQHLSIANIGVSSLEQFPALKNLQRLILSDNRIAGGLEFLVEGGLESLRDLDLSNNRIQFIEDLSPLAQLRLVSLDLYECPVTRVKDYRSRVFGLIKSLKYLDKMDAEENERPESDDEEDEEDDEDDDPGSGEVDGEDRPYRMSNGHSVVSDGIVDVDEDEESDADEEETETSRRANGSAQPSHLQANGFRVVAAVNGGEGDEEDDDDGEDDEENDSGEEIDEEDGEDEDVVELHEVDSDDDEDDEDVVELHDVDDEDEDDEEVDNEERDFPEPESVSRLTSTEGEIDGHEQGEEDGDEDDNGETGEEEFGVEGGEFEEEEDAEEEDEDYGGGYLVQPVGQAEEVGDMDPANVEDDEEDVEDDEEEDQLGEVQVHAPPSSSALKRKRDEDAASVEDEDDEENYTVEQSKSSKHK